MWVIRLWLLMMMATMMVGIMRTSVGHAEPTVVGVLAVMWL